MVRRVPARDLDPDGLAPTHLWGARVYQFRHAGDPERALAALGPIDIGRIE